MLDESHAAPAMAGERNPSRTTGGVQSIGRAFMLLEKVVDNGGVMGLSRLADVTGLPLPTIHRLVRTLVDLGYLRQEPSRQYAVGPRLTRLAEGSTQMLASWARPHLSKLVADVGESANLAMLDSDHAVYVAQVPSRYQMRMFTEVGRRVPLHCTAVGKAMLAQLEEAKVREIIDRAGMPAQTQFTISDLPELIAHLDLTRARGYSTDEGEQEVGVRCIAVPVLGAPLQLAMSVSGPTARMTDHLVVQAFESLQVAAQALAADLNA
jgi:IclR family acetate operon transcriptional repressor